MRKALGITVVALCALTQAALWFGHGGVVALWHREHHIEALKQGNAHLLKTDERLTAEIRSLEHGEAAIQGYARAGLGMVKKGETFYEIIPGRPPVHKRVARVFRNQQLAARG